ncbi:SAM-dependent methyltransferase [Flavitalea flava]
MWYISLLEKNRIPDFLLRQGIRKLLKQRLKDEDKGAPVAQQTHFASLIELLKASPIAINTREANEQHFELPTSFYQFCLGKHLKYSSGYWNPGVTDLDQAEADMLELTCQRAELKDGQQVLELGCGWGSLSLFMAARYPNSRFTVVSNSRTQKEFIDSRIPERGLTNLRVITADMNDLGDLAGLHHSPEKGSFDRIVSVEMFEHMRNYQLLMELCASFLKPEGKLFVHIFTHRQFVYLFEEKDGTDWMSRYFFTGGIMPSNDLLLHFSDHLSIEKQWSVNGTHYGRTAGAWLQNMDRHKPEIIPLFERVYGRPEALKWWVHWRIFFMACTELWNYGQGNEWMVSHYLFRKPQDFRPSFL